MRSLETIGLSSPKSPSAIVALWTGQTDCFQAAHDKMGAHSYRRVSKDKLILAPPVWLGHKHDSVVQPKQNCDTYGQATQVEQE